MFPAKEKKDTQIYFTKKINLSILFIITTNFK